MSSDHNTTLEPLFASRIEVLRGPSTLLYGSSAVGGVVNVIDSTIPERAPEGGTTGEFALRAGGAARERSELVIVDAPQSVFATVHHHADVHERAAGGEGALEQGGRQALARARVGQDQDAPGHAGGLAREHAIGVGQGAIEIAAVPRHDL